MRILSRGAVLALAVLLASCGGGGSSESEPGPAAEPERDRTAARVRMARTLIAEGQIVAAREQLERLAEDPAQRIRRENVPEWTDDVIAGLLRRGALDLADSLLQAIGPVSVRTPRQRILTASLLMMRGDDDTAVAVYEGIRTEDPALKVRGLRELATLRMRRGEYDAALDRGREALAIEPESGPLRILVARALTELGRADEGLAELRLLPPSVARWTAEAEILLDAHDRPDTAIVLLRRATAQAPSDRGITLILVRALIADGQPTEALRILEPLVASGVTDPRLQLLAADAFEAAGQPERATLLRERLEEQQRRIERDALRAEGLLLSQEDRPEAALERFDAALGLFPDDGELLHDRGVALARLERWDEARRALEAASRLRPDDPSILVNLARLFDRRGNVAARDSVLARAEALGSPRE